MREGVFVRKNIDKWKKFEQEPSSSPDEMARQFTELINDLGYAKTFYPHSKATKYLNGLTTKIYLDIYRNKREKGSRILNFWKTELPLVVKRNQTAILWSLIIFLTFVLMAVFSSMNDMSFIRGVLGDRYVDMTGENIAKGDPFGVYKHHNKFEMFITIALNNIKVSFMVFITGFLGGIGTIWLLFQNGIMLGSFQTMFFLEGLGWESILVIWIHGALEISAIVIAGGGGLIIGKAVLFPGTYKRVESIKRGAKDGIKLMIGLVPIFIAAGFLEGYITRLTEMPVTMSIAILFASFFFIIWYFVVYPQKVYKKQIEKLTASIP